MNDDNNVIQNFILKYGLKTSATSNTKYQKILLFLSLSDVGDYLKDDPFSSDLGVVNLHATKGARLVA